MQMYVNSGVDQCYLKCPHFILDSNAEYGVQISNTYVLLPALFLGFWAGQRIWTAVEQIKESNIAD